MDRSARATGRQARRRLLHSGFALIGLGLIGACGLPSPLAQAPPKIPRVGFLIGSPFQSQHEGFRQGLRELGYAEGQNVVVEYRSGEGQPDRVAVLAEELVRLPVDVIVAGGAPSARAAAGASNTIPIVMFLPDDPVASGLVASLARPGGNVTGVTSISPQLAGKRFALLKEGVPSITQVAVLGDPELPQNMREWSEIEASGRTLGVGTSFLPIRQPSDIEGAFETVARRRADGLIPLQNTVVISQLGRILELAAHYRLPSIHDGVAAAVGGGLMSYGPNGFDLYRRTATYVDKILKGAKPADLPVEQPTTFDFVINLKTARALGLTMPSSILAQATELIE